MNQEQFNRFWKQLKGALQKQWGTLTDEDLRQIDGDLQKFNATIQQRFGDRKTEVSKWADRRFARWTGWYEGYEEPNPAS